MIQRSRDGHELTVGEAAQLMRAAGLKDTSGDRRVVDGVAVGWTPDDIRSEYDAEGDAADG